jgi:hypothetical protein
MQEGLVEISGSGSGGAEVSDLLGYTLCLSVNGYRYFKGL